MKSLYHPGGQLLNIVSGEMALEKANPHGEVAKFHSIWPKGFWVPITKPVILMDTKRNS